MSEVLFSPEELDDALTLLVAELVAVGVEARFQIVGAAAVTLQVGREALTRDIDALYASTPELDEVIKRIARVKNWPDTWINNAVQMFVSHYDTQSDWDLRSEVQGVVVLVARPQLLLAMKLLAGRGRRDADDIDRLLDKCEITSVQAAKNIFDRYYPTEVIAAPALAQLHARYG
ncbi:MAG: DUF6036 family nucleotidyltransferase [Acidimicrobiales bacterium]